MYLTSDGKKFFDENEAIMHESTLDKLRIKERRWDKMKTKIAGGEHQTLHSSVPSARMKKSDDSP